MLRQVKVSLYTTDLMPSVTQNSHTIISKNISFPIQKKVTKKGKLMQQQVGED